MQPIGCPFIILASVDSTNNYAMAMVQEGLASHGTTIFAMEQLRGKGQRGKIWQTEPGQNIALSAVIVPAIALQQQFLFNMCISLGCYDFFSNYAGEDTSIKWPNDIYWRDRKAGGILIENMIKGQHWQYAITGIGININQVHFNQFQHTAVSLQQITGKKHDVVALAKELCNCLQQRLETLKQQNALTIFEEYQQHLFKRGEKVTLKEGNKVFETVITGVNLQGQLLTKDVLERSFDFGTITWVLS